MSLQNGVDNAETLTRHLTQAVVPVAVYAATAMPGPGEVRHHGRGDQVIGPIDATAAADATLASRLRSVVNLFASAQMPVRISPDVIGELWRKLMVNCAYNAVSGLTRQPYGPMAALPAVVELQRAVVREVVGGGAGRGADDGLGRVDGCDVRHRRGHAGPAFVHRAGQGARSTDRDRPPQRLRDVTRRRARGAHAGEPDPAFAGQIGGRQPRRRLRMAEALLLLRVSRRRWAIGCRWFATTCSCRIPSCCARPRRRLLPIPCRSSL